MNRDLTPNESDCISRRLLRELKRVERRGGVIKLDETINGQPAYPYLAVLLHCKCGEAHPDDALKQFIDRFYVQGWRFSDGLPITYKQARAALHHTFFGPGSLDDRRNDIISDIFEVESQDKTAPNYRKGYDVGTYRRTKEDQLLLAFAKNLTELLYLQNEEPDPAVAAESNSNLAILDLSQDDDEKKAA
ncbi:hypothetical protein [Pseudarthrobacter oxydans]|uniref:hypothetical protein n=1 Tax=Pseudarthrobacter oxydans TaxID=1671 RepID=UPI0035F00F53|nr:hypothetical protein GCM10017547_38390 [Pseudarthrobacter oxydans]